MNVIVGIEPNSPLTYDPGLELHHLIVSMLGVQGIPLDKYIYIY